MNQRQDVQGTMRGELDAFVTDAGVNGGGSFRIWLAPDWSVTIDTATTEISFYDEGFFVLNYDSGVNSFTPYASIKFVELWV